MTDEQKLESKFWDFLEESPFVMLGLKGSGFTRPMTAQIDKDRQIYFFASRSDELVTGLAHSTDAIATYASKGHDFFASMKGVLVVNNDREKIDRLWSVMISAWYEQGKDDPDLVLLRFDTDRADVWEAGTGSAVKAAWLKLTGRDPKEQSQEDRAQVML
ncbi:MAG TPA: pyridoxamine 5'-phosphate oxidase family protein [Sphingomicrobium sp.]|nr:pyridoxamine 5'-phosphate oxidase family protein [Sphingomicrobium sp.]